MKSLSYPQAIVVASFFASVALLGAFDRDTSALIIAGMGVLGALGLIVNQVAGTKEQATAAKEEANGKQARLLDIIETQGKMLAGMVPITPAMQGSWASVDSGGLAEAGKQADQTVERSADQPVTDQVADQTRPIGFGIHAVTPRVFRNDVVSWVEATVG